MSTDLAFKVHYATHAMPHTPQPHTPHMPHSVTNGPLLEGPCVPAQLQLLAQPHHASYYAPLVLRSSKAVGAQTMAIVQCALQTMTVCSADCVKHSLVDEVACHACHILQQ